MSITTQNLSSQESFLGSGSGSAPLVYSSKSQRKDLGESFWEQFQGFELYRSSVRVVKNFTRKNNGAGAGNRENIFQFSESSKRNLRFRILNSAYDFTAQFCLTYHENVPRDGRTIKKHLNVWLQYIRRNYPDLKYLWILEFQTKREAPHYHVFFNTRANTEMGMDLAEAWNRITDETETHLRVHSHHANFISWDMGKGSYLTKYLDKEQQKNVPENFLSVGRFWGSSRGIVTDAINYSRQIIGDCWLRAGEFYGDIFQERTDYATGESVNPGNYYKYMYRCLRKYHEKKVNMVRKKLGVKGAKYRSPIMRVTSSLIMDASKPFLQIVEYLEKEYAQLVPF